MKQKKNAVDKWRMEEENTRFAHISVCMDLCKCRRQLKQSPSTDRSRYCVSVSVRSRN